VAIIDADKAVRGAFELGAHFVLYKPISAERAKTSFRAARALMKRERRRNTRIPVEIPVVLQYPGTNPQRTVTSDIGEGGIAVRPAPTANATQMVVQLTLPGSNCKIECTGEVAWANSSRQAGIRFSDLTPETTSQLKSWLDSHAPELDKDDPPVPATLTDLSPGGGYLQTGAPFPVRTRVVLSLGGAGVSSAAAQVRAEGIVRVAHPEVGMGVEFIQRTPAQREQLGRLIEALVIQPPRCIDSGDRPLARPVPLQGTITYRNLPDRTAPAARPPRSEWERGDYVNGASVATISGESFISGARDRN
jgi:c-di-GMP-binding flagellar brake protein YcgR